ncbi:MAG: hypothetical protein JSS38_00085 [Nitrospira sp.]|nr:hypothetical protein [Nitrospira sp.]MBS0152967.1 hypothetical protein [Nitrospira sp.]MBS0167324.1 hypothetical protein [Nitrospira sp.]
MERRAASHTEEEEMNQRRKLLSAARRGDTKAISKLFELYQVRVLSGDQLAKVNRTSTYMAPVKSSSGSRSRAAEKTGKMEQAKGGKKSLKPTASSEKSSSNAKTAAKPKSKSK